MDTLSLSMLIFFIFLPPTLSKRERYNVVDFGAKPDGRMDSSVAFLGAWKAACNEDSDDSLMPPIIYVPQGRYLITSALIFSGHHCKPMINNKGIILRIEGTLVAPADYLVFKSVTNWLSFENIVGLIVSGGSLDGQGAGLWACKKGERKDDCPTGTATLAFTNSRDIIVSGLTSVNSQLFHVVINGCENVKLQGLKVLASGFSPNTDGIHVQYSNNIMISNSKIGTGDDCISIGAGTAKLSISNVVCGPGHGISIGSLGRDMVERGVENVTVTSVTLKNTQNGVRIKSWGKPSTGFVRNVMFRKITMDNVQNPIIIDQNYCPYNIDCPGKVSGIKISDVTYKDIHGTSATEVAVKLECSSKYPCTKIWMENVSLTYKDQVASSSCANAVGTVAGTVEPISCFKETN